jgi:RND family efflux transporter MFP subunit
MKKIILLLLVTAGIVAAVMVRITSLKAQEKIKHEGIENIQRREGFPVGILPVNRGPFLVWREIQGKVEGYVQAFISTSDSARVARIGYKIGDRVAADTPIISLDENDPRNLSQVKLLRSVYENAVKDYDRYSNLYESGGVSKDVVDKMHLQLKTAKSYLDAAQTTVQLTSPVDGVLLALYIRVGEVAEKDKTLAIVSQLDTVRIVAAVSDRDIAEFIQGQPVSIKADSGKLLEGTVDRISMGANPETGLFDLELKVDNHQRDLRVGMFVTARIRVFERDDGTFVDSRCIMRDFDGTDFIFQADQSKAKKVPVTVLRSNDMDSLIEGANADQPVILSGKMLLSEGASLKIVEKGAE